MAMTGDAYVLPIIISLESGVATDYDLSDVEVTIGSIRKTLSDGEITFDSDTNEFLVPLSQEETFKLRGKRDVDVRVKLLTGEVIGVKAGEVEHIESQSKQVI